MKVKEVIVNHLECNQDYHGEYNSFYNVDFLLTENINFDVFGVNHIADRIKMRTKDWYDEDIILIYANSENEFRGITINKKLLRALYKKLLQEQKNGKLKGWSFEEEIRFIYDKS